MLTLVWVTQIRTRALHIDPEYKAASIPREKHPKSLERRIQLVLERKRNPCTRCNKNFPELCGASVKRQLPSVLLEVISGVCRATDS